MQPKKTPCDIHWLRSVPQHNVTACITVHQNSDKKIHLCNIISGLQLS